MEYKSLYFFIGVFLIMIGFILFLSSRFICAFPGTLSETAGCFYSVLFFAFVSICTGSLCIRLKIKKDRENEKR
ncbi:MAG: hypothetical protein ACFE94_11805 [Candidatus Hodarchaeota archaeon]